jgi:hypothetical protein
VGATLTLETGTRLFLETGVTLTVNGALVINDAEWVQFYEYGGNTAINVNGRMTVTGTAFTKRDWSGTSAINVAAGAVLEATGCSFGMDALNVMDGSAVSLSNNTLTAALNVAANSTVDLSNNRFSAAVYCPVEYVPRLVPNLSFGTVYITLIRRMS